MNAITIDQPWASAIACGIKRIAPMSWQPATSDFTRIAIHASRRWAAREQTFWIKHACSVSETAAVFARNGILHAEDLKFGYVIATVELYGCQRAEDMASAGVLSDQERAWGDFTPGMFCWLLRNPQILPEPVLALNTIQRIWEWKGGPA